MGITQTGAVIIAEIPTVTAMAGAVIGWMVKRSVARVDTVEDEQSHQAGQIATQDVRLAAVERIVDSHDRRLPSIAENLAIVAAFVERHERWHERHDQRSPSPPE